MVKREARQQKRENDVIHIVTKSYLAWVEIGIIEAEIQNATIQNV